MRDQLELTVAEITSDNRKLLLFIGSVSKTFSIILSARLGFGLLDSNNRRGRKILSQWKLLLAVLCMNFVMLMEVVTFGFVNDVGGYSIDFDCLAALLWSTICARLLYWYFIIYVIRF